MKERLIKCPTIRRYTPLIVLLILSLMPLACHAPGGDDKESSQPTTTLLSTDGVGVQVVSPHTAPSFRGRMTATITLKDGSECTETKTMVWIHEPPAGHYVYTTAGGETKEQIFAGDKEWMRVDESAWAEKSTAYAEGGYGAAWLADAFDTPLSPDLPFLLPGGTLPLSGKFHEGVDTVGGIRCLRYALRATLLSQSLPFDLRRTVCVAEHDDLPPVPVRVVAELSVDAQEAEFSEIKIAIDLYDFGSPITVQPPENVVGQGPEPQATQVPANVETVQLASLDTLDSYRGYLVIRAKPADGSETTQTRTLEWVSEPPSGHYVHTKPDETVEEQIVIGDTAWTKVSTDRWSERVSTRGPGGQGFDYLLSALSQRTTLAGIEPDGSGALTNMALLGSEAVNGVECKHYLGQEPAPRVEVWVADQDDLPTVLVRVLVQSSGHHQVETELGLYDLNVPVRIGPPQ
jgi:hypothetical protein